MPDEEKVNTKGTTRKPAEEKTLEPASDACESPSPPGPVDIPYPNSKMSSDTSSGNRKAKIDGEQVMTIESSIEKSTGDEPGQSDTKGLDKVTRVMKSTKVLSVPLWIWGVISIVLIIIFWLLVSSNPQPIEHVEALELN